MQEDYSQVYHAKKNQFDCIYYGWDIQVWKNIQQFLGHPVDKFCAKKVYLTWKIERLKNRYVPSIAEMYHSHCLSDGVLIIPFDCSLIRPPSLQWEVG